ncbi:MAG TPA: hypothetical protein VHG52_13995 [Thermomicrobiales bacterium]|nr:hypothetical protein [Thermomicrobiales bacterium]
MLRNVLLGMAAGAAGTTALNIVTYMDMAIRGRGSSSVPADVVGTIAEKTGTQLGEEDSVVQSRKSGLGGLLGYETGLGIGAVYGLIRSPRSDLPASLAGVGLGAAAMVASDVPATALGVTNPKEWTLSSWLSDIIPHLAYGIVTALVMDQFRRR